MRTLHAVLPAGVDDPRRPSGGNLYDRRVLDGLRALGWTVREHLVPGEWPHADAAASSAFESALRQCPDGAPTLVDGLLVSEVSGLVEAAAARLRLAVLAHMAFGAADPAAAAGERVALRAGNRVVTTSDWTRQWLVAQYGLPPGRVHVVHPGVDPAPAAPGTVQGDELLCVAAVTPGKGHDVLLAALAHLTDLPWRCTCVGALEVDPVFASRLQRHAAASDLGQRIRFTGPLAGADLDQAYAGADLLVTASRGESYGMVLAEALARGLPVVATAVGGVEEALGRADDGSRPALLVPVDDVEALASAVRRWLTDADVREALRAAARSRRASLEAWPDSAGALSQVLSGMLSEPAGRHARMSR